MATTSMTPVLLPNPAEFAARLLDVLEGGRS